MRLKIVVELKYIVIKRQTSSEVFGPEIVTAFLWMNNNV